MTEQEEAHLAGLQKEALRLLPASVVFGLQNPTELELLRSKIVLALLAAERRGLEAAYAAIKAPYSTES